MIGSQREIALGTPLSSGQGREQRRAAHDRLDSLC